MQLKNMKIAELTELARQLGPVDDTPPSSLEALKAKRETLEKQAERLAGKINDLRKTPPFHLEGKLEDEAWLETRRAEIETRIDELGERRVALEARLDEILTEIKGE